ncbi:glycosyltransferase family 2 protein [Flavobacterium sp. Arc2]|uniref:glycosyltransferase family 2 protein n=1 Tax=Flavobacterium sp. Arc2 TaxID=3046685 RepID=UPI00352C5D61
MKSCVIIITYNGMQWINECLQSILDSSISTTIIVVDNCSNDSTVDHIKTNFSNVILLEQNENLGFGRANNIAMAYALKAGMDYVFLLNQDAFVNKNTIEKLVRVAQSKPEYGVLSPVQLDYSGKLLETYFFSFMAEDNSRSFYSDFVLGNPLKKIYDISFIQAAAWFLPINTVKKIGGFDPLFYHYGEDNNYCQRVLYHKMNIGVVPDAFIRHDSYKPKSEKVGLFSQKYFDIYTRDIAVKFANINLEFTLKNIASERKKNYKIILYNFLKGDFVKARGFFKQLHVLNKTVKLIETSRNKNVKMNSNYINLE